LSLNDDLAKYKEDSFMQRLKSFMVMKIAEYLSVYRRTCVLSQLVQKREPWSCIEDFFYRSITSSSSKTVSMV